MRIVTHFPHEIVELENEWIVLADGTRLAARIWMPREARERPVPALLEYLPYRKNDGTAVRDSIRHPYLAGHGYAAVRVDMRGSGDSDGILLDEYLPQEQADALEILEWIAAQSWCTGKIGMFGKSWGGFNALQIAAHRPPALKAIITIASTDDRYADDVHYMGGCLLAYDMLPWASIMLTANATPPDPRWVGERWREMWLRRIEETPAYIESWMTHQRRSDYWKQGSVCEDWGAIDIPVYAVGGWADGYTNAIPRLLAGLRGPRKGLIGPWAHNFPEEGVPGPAIGFLQESLRWWDTWLKGIDTGIMDEPMLASWLQESDPPRTFYPDRRGRWVADPAWPSSNVKPETRHLGDGGRLMAEASALRFPPATAGVLSSGYDTQAWCPYGLPGNFAPDQRATDGQWLTFTMPPADQPADYLGFPRVRLQLMVDRPQAQVAARLCDVGPDGSSTLVSYGVLNLTHRNGHELPEPVPVKEPVAVEFDLNAIGYTLLPGHAWRLSLSPSYWPMVWPSPEEVMLTVLAGSLELPRRETGEALPPPAFLPPECAPPINTEVIRTGKVTKNWCRDLITGRAVLEAIYDEGRLRFAESGLEIEDWRLDRFTSLDGDPLTAAVDCAGRLAYRREDWAVRVETTSRMTADRTHFYLTNRLEAFEGEVRVAARSWERKIPRDGV